MGSCSSYAWLSLALSPRQGGDELRQRAALGHSHGDGVENLLPQRELLQQVTDTAWHLVPPSGSR